MGCLFSISCYCSSALSIVTPLKNRLLGQCSGSLNIEMHYVMKEVAQSKYRTHVLELPLHHSNSTLSYPEFDEEESISWSFLKQVFQSTILLGKLVSYMQNIHCLVNKDNINFTQKHLQHLQHHAVTVAHVQFLSIYLWKKMLKYFLNFS